MTEQQLTRRELWQDSYRMAHWLNSLLPEALPHQFVRLFFKAVDEMIGDLDIISPIGRTVEAYQMAIKANFPALKLYIAEHYYPELEETWRKARDDVV